ncbi:MAG: glutamine--tRNA ligase, partial [Nitrospiraceae bacterium]
LERIMNCLVEPSLQETMPGTRYQFERLGYFCTDLDSASGALVFNRTVSLKDAWAKVEKTQTAR